MTHDPTIILTGRRLTFSADVIRRNPHLHRALGPVASSEQKPDAGRTLGGNAPAPKSRGARVASGGVVLRVTIIHFRHRIADSDNLCAKALRDEVAREFGLDDEDGTIAWEYSQHQTRGAEGTVVKVEVLA